MDSTANENPEESKRLSNGSNGQSVDDQNNEAETYQDLDLANATSLNHNNALWPSHYSQANSFAFMSHQQPSNHLSDFYHHAYSSYDDPSYQATYFVPENQLRYYYGYHGNPYALSGGQTDPTSLSSQLPPLQPVWPSSYPGSHYPSAPQLVNDSSIYNSRGTQQSQENFFRQHQQPQANFFRQHLQPQANFFRQHQQPQYNQYEWNCRLFREIVILRSELGEIKSCIMNLEAGLLAQEGPGTRPAGKNVVENQFIGRVKSPVTSVGSTGDKYQPCSQGAANNIQPETGALKLKEGILDKVAKGGKSSNLISTTKTKRSDRVKNVILGSGGSKNSTRNNPTVAITTDQVSTASGSSLDDLNKTKNSVNNLAHSSRRKDKAKKDTPATNVRFSENQNLALQSSVTSKVAERSAIYRIKQILYDNAGVSGDDGISTSGRSDLGDATEGERKGEREQQKKDNDEDASSGSSSNVSSGL